MAPVFEHTHPLGFLVGSRSEDAKLLIGQTEMLVTTLGPTAADLQPAAEALGAAKALYAAQEYSRAVAQAIHAGALAVSLNERFNAYMVAWRTLQSCMEDMERLEFPTDSLHAALEAADKEMVRPVDEDGTSVPNYLGATAMLERATEEARALLARARAASREIFLATLAVESLSNSPSTQTPSPLAARLEQMVAGAAQALALGRLSEASRIATEARARADAALSDAARVWDMLDMAAAILDGLEADVPSADALRGRLAAGRKALEDGQLDRARGLEVARGISDDVAEFARHYPKARKALERAERVYTSLQDEGFGSADVEATLSGARHALAMGEWDDLKQRIVRATSSFVELQEDRKALTKALAEIDGRVTLLKEFHLRMLPEVQEVLGRARDEIRSFQLSSANEHLVLAGTLMTEATRSGS